MKALTKCLVLVIVLSSSQLKAQIGINTLTPDSSAALDVNPKLGKNAGILIPRLTQAQRIAIPLPSKGLMVYDITDDLFYVNLTSGIHSWYAINPWITTATTSTSNVMYTHNTVTNVGIGTSNPSSKLEVIGDIKATNITAAVSVNTNTLAANTLTVPGFPLNSLVPTGAIMLWTGTSPPAGWALCDGGSGRPDLRGRFVVGYDAGGSNANAVAANNGIETNYAGIGNTGGETGHTLSLTEIPSHNHSVGITGCNSFLSASNGCVPGNNAIGGSGAYTVDAAAVGVSETSKGGGLVHENRPPYYVLAYIIKL